MRWALLLVPLLLTAGCIGSEDEAVEPGSTNGTAAEATNASASNASALTRSNETVEGTITGIGSPVLGFSAPSSENQAIEFPVPEGAKELTLALSTDGGTTGMVELEMLVARPGCEINSGCEESVTTSGGEATFSAQDPDTGTWGARFFVDTGAAAQASYTLEISTLAPAS